MTVSNIIITCKEKRLEKHKNEILTKLESHLATSTSKYKVYKNSLKFFDNYALIYYQSNSVVDFNIPDDDMIYGIGTLMFRISDEKIFEIYSHVNKEEQIMKILAQD